MGQLHWEMPRAADDIDSDFSKACFTPLLAAVLRARGADTPEKAALFLRRDSGLLHDPFLLTDMDKAVSRIYAAVKNGEKLAVYGDYDVDGISSACLLLDYFIGLGLQCEVYIPDRLDEGYGVSKRAVDALYAKSVDLIITVDCGITAVSETAYAKSLGMDIIITDHHECPQVLPDAAAVIDPKRHGSAYPFTELAGVGVAFKLVCALENDKTLPFSRYADLVAVGTIADVMPLVGENRYLAHIGLEKLKNKPLPGFAALLEEAGAAQKPLNAATIGFTLAPRINAAGRLCRTETALRLLLSKNHEEALVWAKELCSLNRRRQELETIVWEEALATLSESEPKSPIVLESESWHPGVVGIAASRLTEKFRFPTIMICVDEGNGKGSCRSYGDFNLFEALGACSEYLESFGGHAFAAGLNIKKENIGAFRIALGEYYFANIPAERPELEPELLISDPAVLNMAGVESLSALEPYGSGNESPILCMAGARLDSISPIGGGKHLRLRVTLRGISFDCVFFSRTAESLSVAEGDKVDLCFAPQINDFHSRRSVQLLVADIRKSVLPDVCRGILEHEQPDADALRIYRPERVELACLWRSLIRLGGRLELDADCAPRDRELASFDPVRLCLGVKVFAELGLLELQSGSAGIVCLARESWEKTELERSWLFRQLWA